MKGSGKIIVFISCVTLLLVLYVHTQISLFRVSYLIDSKAKIQSKKIEEYRFLKYEVNQMRAPRVLEEKISHLDFDMTLPEEIQFVRVPLASGVTLPASVKTISPRPFIDPIMGFLERWVQVAQAKTET